MMGNVLPIRRGWYRMVLLGLEKHETIEVRLDFGLGFLRHHSVTATGVGGEASLFVRLFKPLLAVEVLARASRLPSKPKLRLSFEKVSASALWWRRLVEQLHLVRRSLAAGRIRSKHDLPRRLWGWRGLQAFPSILEGNGESSYQMWRRLPRPAPRQASPKDWALVLDCRAGEPGEQAFRAFTRAAQLVGASSVLRGGDVLDEVVREFGPDRCWTMIVSHDVILDDHCLATFSNGARNCGALVLYCDNDHSNEHRKRYSPELRTHFSAERLNSEDWLGGVLALHSEAALLAQGPNENLHALARNLCAALGPQSFGHIPEILYSSTSRPGLPPRPDRSHSATRPVKASIIIPTRDRASLLKRCIDSIVERTRAGDFEILIHDNASSEPEALRLLDDYSGRSGFRILRDALPFNYSRINNEAAALAANDLLIFLNNDTEVTSADWIERLGAVARDPSVGCAGPLLLHRDGTIQHAGLVTGPGGIAMHIHAGLRPHQVDFAAPIVRRDVSALTGACLAIEKSKFTQAGGFDAEHLAVAFNDVDLCLRLERRGLRNIFVPEVELVHLGSATRDDDDYTSGSDRFRAEFRLMRERWGERLDHDPFFPGAMCFRANGPELRLA